MKAMKRVLSIAFIFASFLSCNKEVPDNEECQTLAFKTYMGFPNESKRFKDYCLETELKYTVASCQQAFNVMTLGKKPNELKKLFGPRILECFSESDKKRILGP